MQSVSFGFVPKIGKVQNINFLTQKGKRLLEEYGLQENEIRIPIGRSTHFFKDYFHRCYTIDFHIELSKWAESNESSLIFFDTYFDKLGNNRQGKNLRAKTKVDLPEGYLIPDGVFKLKYADLTNALFLFEMYNGKDTLRTLNQLKKHLYAMESGSVNEKYEFKYGYRVLCVFEEETMMKALMERLQEDRTFKHFKEYFLFKSLEDVRNGNVISGWVDFTGEKHAMI